MQRLEVSGAVRPIYASLGVKRLNRLLSNVLRFKQGCMGGGGGDGTVNLAVARNRRVATVSGVVLFFLLNTRSLPLLSSFLATFYSAVRSVVKTVR